MACRKLAKRAHGLNPAVFIVAMQEAGGPGGWLPLLPLQSPDHLAFQMWLASPKGTRWLRDFCVIQWCFVVLLGELQRTSRERGC